MNTKVVPAAKEKVWIMIMKGKDDGKQSGDLEKGCSANHKHTAARIPCCPGSLVLTNCANENDTYKTKLVTSHTLF